MTARSIGLLVVGIGIGVVVLGLVIWAGGLAWFGNLPGDIRIQGENTRVFIPITSMLLVSVLLTIVLNVLARLF